MAQISDLQQAAGLTQVIWVDDCFAEQPEQLLRIDIQRKLASLYGTGIVPRHNAFSSIDSNAPIAIREKLIEKVIDENAEKLTGIADSLTKQLAELLINNEDKAPDLTPAQVIRLRNSLTGVTTLSFRTWQTRQQELLSTAGEQSLFLIDREFTNEGQGPEVGDSIIAQIVEIAPKAHCILLTHTVGPDKSDELRVAIGRRGVGLLSHQFAVMSKRGLGQLSNDAAPYFARALKTTLLHRFCFDIADRTARIMEESAKHAVDDLATLSVEEIDTAIFENSLVEGASEVDVVARILMLRQRMSVQEQYAECGEIFQRLIQIRAVRETDIVCVPSAELTGRVSPLHHWRVGEVFDDGSQINPVNSPLCCGDVFLHETDLRKYILLAQPCDLVVRGKGSMLGKRNCEEGIFVCLGMGKPADELKERFFVVKGMEPDGSPWSIDFRNAISVNLHVLDLAVFNSAGRVRWTESQELQEALLPGWQNRFRNLATEMALGPIPQSIRSLCFAGGMLTATCIPADGICAFPLVRIGRIRSPYAEAIHASYAAFMSRAAFDHDFAKGLCAISDEAEESVSAESRQVNAANGARSME
ncbi:MAG: hypothetical protein JXA73_07260 [Acidobacteria bacterium]|nr:hypothetical protein [Acidobacteriota bacterium]